MKQKAASVLVLLLLLASGTNAQPAVRVVGSNVLKKELQLKLDEWHKGGKFP